MSEKSIRLLAALSGIRDDTVEEAAGGLPREKIHWKRWTALAACLAVVVIGAGIFTGRLPWPRVGIGGGSGAVGTNPPEEGPSTFMSYAGPVLPLTLKEENDTITAERAVTLDFTPWIRTWWSNEDEANSRDWLTEEERQEVLDNYNEWYPRGAGGSPPATSW